MSKLYIVPALLALASATSSFGSTTCKVASEIPSLALASISWDTESKQAKILTKADETISGQVTFSRPHNQGVKVNLAFSLSERERILNDELEFMIFPTGNSGYRLVVIGYRVIQGTKVLNTSLGNYEATCTTL